MKITPSNGFAGFSNHPLAAVTLQNPLRKKTFDSIMLRLIGIAIFHKRSLLEPFEIPRQFQRDCHFNRFKAALDVFLNCVSESYQFFPNAREKGYGRQYMFTTEFFKCDIVFTDTDFDFEKLIKTYYNINAVNLGCDSLSKLTLKDGKTTVKTVKQANHFINKFLTATITGNYITKRLSIDKYEKTYLEKGVKKPILQPVNEFLEFRAKAAQMAGGYILNELRQGHFFCSCSETNGRLNSSFTSLAEVLTGFLRINNQFLQGVDIKNSQFLLLSHLLENCNPQSEKRLFNFIYSNGFDKHILGKSDGEKYTVGHLIAILKEIVLNSELTPDFDAFLDDSFAGVLYDKFSKSLNVSRSAAKISTFAVLFGTGNGGENVELFKAVYPSVFGITKQFKSKTHYSILSVFLQKIESLIFIECLLPLVQGKNKIQCLTRHDSIYCAVSDFKRMDRTIRTVFDDIFNGKYEMK